MEPCLCNGIRITIVMVVGVIRLWLKMVLQVMGKDGSIQDNMNGYSETETILAIIVATLVNTLLLNESRSIGRRI